MPDMRFENDVLGLVPAQEWLDVGMTSVTRPNDPMDSLFGDERTDNIVGRWQSIAADYQLPVMANFHAFDTEANATFRIPVDNHSVEKGLIKVKINQSERLRALIRSGVQNNQLYEYVINDGVRLADQVITRTKVAKAEIMATGKMSIKENNLNLTVDYGVPGAQTGFTLDLGADADAPAAIQEVIDAATAKGVTITGMLTSRKVLAKLRGNTAIQKSINGVNGAGALVRAAALNDYLADEFGIGQVIADDLQYAIPDGVDASGRPKVKQKRYYPDNKVTFFAANPGGKLGVGLWGDPPETDVSKLLNVAQSEQSPYVYITQWSEKDPAVLWTKASSLFMPVLYNPASLWIATVA